jgi:hypothetical protein
MKCPVCGKAIQAPEQFCPGCGARLSTGNETAGRKTSNVDFGKVSGRYGNSIRQQVFEVIVRQALAGAPWREICSGPMAVNHIGPEEVEEEMRRRIGGIAFSDGQLKGCESSNPQRKGWEPELTERKDMSESVKLPAKHLQEIRRSLEELINSDDSLDSVKASLSTILKDILALGVSLAALEAELRSVSS